MGTCAGQHYLPHLPFAQPSTGHVLGTVHSKQKKRLKNPSPVKSKQIFDTLLQSSCLHSASMINTLLSN